MPSLSNQIFGYVFRQNNIFDSNGQPIEKVRKRLDDSTRFGNRACEAGGDAIVVIWKNMWHVFQAFAPYMPEARQSIHEIGEFVQAVTK